MKAFMTFLLVAGISHVETSSSDHLPLPLQHVISLGKNLQLIQGKIATHGLRWKRRVGDTLDTFCMNRCIQRMMNGLKNLGINEQSNNVLIGDQVLETDVFEDYCNISRRGKMCLEGCEIPHALRSRMLDTMFSAPQYLCVDHYDELRSYLPCYKAAARELARKCIPACGDFREILRRTQQEMKKALRHFNYSGVKNLLAHQCKYFKCHAKCDTPILTRHCGDVSAAELLNNMAVHTLRKSQSLLESVPGGTNFWPDVCRRIADHGFSVLRNERENLNEQLQGLDEELEESFFILRKK